MDNIKEVVAYQNLLENEIYRNGKLSHVSHLCIIFISTFFNYLINI